MIITMIQGERSARRSLSESPRRPAAYLADMMRRDLRSPQSRPVYLAGAAEVAPDVYELSFTIPVQRSIAYGVLGGAPKAVPIDPVTVRVRGMQAHRDAFRERLLREFPQSTTTPARGDA